MKLIATTTGSYPPIPNESPEISIRRAINDQIEAGMDLLVDGQVRADIAGIFAPQIPGFSPRLGRYPIVKKVEPPQSPITVDDYLLARNFANGFNVKAHLTGPVFLAESSSVKAASRYVSNRDRQLIFDIARALAKEARWLSENGARFIQIDEPSFANGANIDDGLEALEIITENIEHPILHVCGDMRKIFNKLLDAPVEILSVEGQYLSKIPELNSSILKDHKKKIAYGCVPVNVAKDENVRRLSREVVDVIKKLGEEFVWGITPNCGLRLTEIDDASRSRRTSFHKMELVVLTARKVEEFIGARNNDGLGI